MKESSQSQQQASSLDIQDPNPEPPSLAIQTELGTSAPM